MIELMACKPFYGCWGPKRNLNTVPKLKDKDALYGNIFLFVMQLAVSTRVFLFLIDLFFLFVSLVDPTATIGCTYHGIVCIECS